MGGSPEHEMSPAMIVVRMQKTFPVRIAEWTLSGIMVTWGVLVLANPGMFADIKTFSFMTQMAPQPVWGFWILMTGLARFIALAVNGAWRPTPHIRAGCAFLSVFVWMQVTFGLIQSHVPNVGLAIYPWFMLLDVYNVFRASSDARESDDRARTS